jgi:hypothetical protein
LYEQLNTLKSSFKLGILFLPLNLRFCFFNPPARCSRPFQVWAVLDLLRVACLHPEASKHLASAAVSFGLFEACLPKALAAAQLPGAPMPLQLTVLRLATNLFYGAPTRAHAAASPARAAALLDAAAALGARPAAHKHVRAAAAALAVNYATGLGDASTAAAAAPAAVPPSLYAGAAAALALATASADPLHAEVRHRPCGIRRRPRGAAARVVTDNLHVYMLRDRT